MLQASIVVLRVAVAVLTVVFMVIVASALVDVRSSGDTNHDPGCHADWFGVIPVGYYCVIP
jgi:hypothetical protein